MMAVMTMSSFKTSRRNFLLQSRIVRKTLRIYDNDAYPVPFRRALPLDAPRARFPDFPSGTTLLKKGTVRREGALPLPCDIIFERNVPMKLRDGTTIYTDVFRPAEEGRYPALIGWSPYGKEIGGQWLDDIEGRSGVPLSSVSEFQKFEAPDPAFWIQYGYVVLNPDARGSGKSQGDITFWGRQLAEDGHDFIEWTATQPWCSGKVALTGNSWLAASQWFIAAERPPHLTAIAPWEGFCDAFRDTSARGGIPAPAFPEAIITTLSGLNGIEDLPRMIVGQQTIDAYWEDKRARVERIEIPAYVVASYTNAAHTHGSFDGYRRLASKDKWLRVNNTNEWLDYFTPAYAQELRQFFDHYLKGEDNGWEKTPRVRISVLDPGGTDVVDRVVEAWPPAPKEARKLYLADDRSLKADAAAAPSSLAYEVDGDGKIEFAFTMPKDAEIVGYMKLWLWVEAEGADDMELSVTAEKRGTDGKAIVAHLGEGASGAISATGLLRVSQRKLDPARSTEEEPYLLHTGEELLKAGEIVPVEIGLWPMGLKFHASEKLVVTVSAHRQMATSIDMQFGTAIVSIPADGGSYEPGTQVPMRNLGGDPSTTPAFVNAQRVPTPASRNKGKHIIHLGGRYDSHLLVPITEA
jgi:uncharacterized protein